MTEPNRQSGENEERIIEIEIERLRPFKEHPFQVKDDKEMFLLQESIEKYGILNPLIVRPVPDGYYEIISGHRRKHAAEKLGYRKVPVIIRVLSEDDSILSMVDSNLHRERISYSEKAFAYKMKAAAMKAQGKRTDLTSSQVATKSDTATTIGQQLGESRDQVYRYIRLTYLIPELLKMVDEQRIAFTPAVEISYLPEREQRVLIDEIEYTDATPSLSQAQRLRKFSNQGRLSVDTVFAVLSEEKPNQKEQVKFMTEDIRKYFPKNYSNKDMQKTIIKLLENWQRKRERNAREER